MYKNTLRARKNMKLSISPKSLLAWVPTRADIARVSWLCTHTVIPEQSPVELLHKDT